MQFVSLVMPYYENPNMLHAHVREWLSYPREVCHRLRVVLVDDGSRDAPALEVVRHNRVGLASRGLDVQVYRVIPDIPWNQDGARNLGMRACNTPFALMTDMDHVLRARDALDMVDMVGDGLPRGVYYMPRQFTTDTKEIPRHPNTFLFNVSDFWAMGGYDEDFAGHYGSDGNFRKCARGAGLQEVPTNVFGLVVWRRADCEDANTHRYGRKDTHFHSHKDPKLSAKMKGQAYRAINPIRFEWRREL
jgi:glycosyl transferase family 2